MPAGRPSTAKRTAFGKRVLAAREQLGLSQAEVAAQLDLTQSAYADWERLPVALRPEQIQKLTVVLQVSTSYLFNETTQQNTRGGPTGKLRRVFEQVAALPRHQQSKVIEFVEAFVKDKRTH
jgi:transcriptional regulator with XRE-family HTH domain